MSDSGKERCRATTASGRPCRAWAMRGSEGKYGRPLCRVHAEGAAAARELALAAARTGMPVPEGTWAGAYERRQLYGVFFEEEEVAALEALATGGEPAGSLQPEVEVARVILRRVLAELAEGGDLRKLGPLALNAARTVARLLRDEQALGPKEGDRPGMEEMVGKALDLLSDEWGVEL